MAWTTPLTAVSNAALTAAQWNASVRDNLLETAPAKATTAGSIFVATAANALAERLPTAASVPATESSATTTYGALTTAGPAVTGSVGARALVCVGAALTTDTVGTRAYMSFAVSGASTVAAADSSALGADTMVASRIAQASRVILQNVTSGTNTFTAQYRVTSTNGTWASRNIVIVPF